MNNNRNYLGYLFREMTPVDSSVKLLYYMRVQDV